MKLFFKIVITILLIGIVISTHSKAQEKKDSLYGTIIYIGISMPHIGISPKEFDSKSFRLRTSENGIHNENALDVYPELEGGYGYDVRAGINVYPGQTYSCWGIEVSYNVTNYNSLWNSIGYSVINEEIWITGKAGSVGKKGNVFFTFGYPLLSDLIVKNGSHKVVNSQVTAQTKDLVLHGGFTGFRTGLELLFPLLIDRLSFDTGIYYQYIRYTHISDVLGDTVEEVMYSGSFVWRIGLRFDLF